MIRLARVASILLMVANYSVAEDGQPVDPRVPQLLRFDVEMMVRDANVMEDAFGCCSATATTKPGETVRIQQPMDCRLYTASRWRRSPRTPDPRRWLVAITPVSRTSKGWMVEVVLHDLDGKQRRVLRAFDWDYQEFRLDIPGNGVHQPIHGVRVKLHDIGQQISDSLGISAPRAGDFLIDAKLVSSVRGEERIVSSPRLLARNGSPAQLRNSSCVFGKVDWKSLPNDAGLLITILPVAKTRHGWLTRFDIEPQWRHTPIPGRTTWRLLSGVSERVEYQEGDERPGERKWMDVRIREIGPDPVAQLLPEIIAERAAM